MIVTYRLRRKHPVRQFWQIVLMLLICFESAAAATQEQADTLFADQQWQQAAAHYTTLLANEPDNANNLGQLGFARDQLGQSRKARKALRQALAAGYQPEARARYALARVLMKLGDEKAAMDELEIMAGMGGPYFGTVRSAPEFEPLLNEPRFLAVIKALQACSSDQHRQFDFWAGSWDVTPAGATEATASNDITIEHDGCVILEQYVTGNFTGMSINFYDAVSKRWHQTWMSNAGGALYLEGGLRSDGAMEMTDFGIPRSDVNAGVNRVVWTPKQDGSVHQYWTSSSDGGQNWSVVFDGVYRRKD